MGRPETSLRGIWMLRTPLTTPGGSCRVSEPEVAPFLDNTWRDTARAIFDNWLGLVYQLTNLDRRLPFMEGIDPLHPLKGLTRG